MKKINIDIAISDNIGITILYNGEMNNYLVQSTHPYQIGIILWKLYGLIIFCQDKKLPIASAIADFYRERYDLRDSFQIIDFISSDLSSLDRVFKKDYHNKYLHCSAVHIDRTGYE